MILENKRARPKQKRRKLSSRAAPEMPTTAYPKGVPLRVSALVHDVLRRKRKKGESWDSFFRRLLNLPDRTGQRDEPLYECWVLPGTGETFLSKALARGQSVRNGVLRGKAGRFEEPKKLREIL